MNFTSSGVNVVILVGPLLLNVALVTLLERKLLSINQMRVGPNKVSWGGLLQPLSDAIKLGVNQTAVPHSIYPQLYSLAPKSALFLMLLLWFSMYSLNGMMIGLFSGPLIIALVSLGVYPLLLGGWSSNNKYSLIGALRGVAQTISYEISLGVIILTIFVYYEALDFLQIIISQKFFSLSILTPLFMIWLFSSLAETNRTPFDFAEGESELVSGFNTEYSASGFTLFFMAEYGMILFFSALTLSFFTPINRNFFFYLLIGMVIIWIWTRATLPRLRYDTLMTLAWKEILPLSFTVLFFILVI